MVQLIRHVRRPEAAEMTVEDVALDRLAETRSAAGGICLPAWRERQRTAQRKVRPRGWCLLQPDHVGLFFCLYVLSYAVSFAVDRFQMRHSTASAFASSRSNRARNSGFLTDSSP